MEEKILIKSEHYSIIKIRSFVYGIPLGCVVLGFLLYFVNFDGSRGPDYWGNYWTILDNMLDPFYFHPGLLIDLGIILVIISLFVGAWLKSYSLTVTDKRVYGDTSWGKRVDLPVDSISAIASSGMKGIAVATSSGRIIFKFIKNRDEVSRVIGDLLINRQNSKETAAPVVTVNTSDAEELKKYKELLDMGVITQDEFDAKKKQLLGL